MMKNFFLCAWVITFFQLPLLAQLVELDSTFGSGGIVNTFGINSAEIVDVVIQPDGKIITVGYTDQIGYYQIQLARYNSDGTLDLSFGVSGIVNTDIGNKNMPYAMVLQQDGKIIVGGSYLANVNPPFVYHCSLLRYNVDGSLDNNFGIAGLVKTSIDVSDGITSLALQADGKIIAGGFAGSKFLLMKFDSNGTLDADFGIGGVALNLVESRSYIESLITQSDGKLIVLGSASDSNSNSKYVVAKYNVDGTLDTAFDTDGMVLIDLGILFYEVPYGFEMQIDKKIVIAGFSGDNCALVRLNEDGSLDNTFGTSGIVLTDASVPGANDMALQFDGKIIVTGNVVVSSFNYGYMVTRFNSDGTLDTNFGTGGKFVIDIKNGNDYSQCLIIDQDNKIVVGGSSRDSSSDPSGFTLIRLTTDLAELNPELILEGDFMLYPIPFSEQLTIKTKLGVEINQITLLSITGNLVKSISSITSDIDLSQISPGSYYLIIQTNKGTISKKISKK